MEALEESGSIEVDFDGLRAPTDARSYLRQT